MIDRTIIMALTVSGLLLAQQPVEQQPVTDHPGDATSPANAKAVSGPASPQWQGLSVKEKLRYDARHLFDVDNLVFAGIGASFDQLRNRPSEWGDGWDALAGRYASHVGQYIIQRSIMFPVQAIDHEDTRYF